jgi:ribosomal protein S18 acetylase RimI-like enzyme
MSGIRIRRATAADATGISEVMAIVAAERIHSAIDQAWTAEEEAEYLRALSTRETLHVAIDDEDRIVGFQSLDLWSHIPSMSHVAQVGTFVAPQWRGRGLGKRLWTDTEKFAQTTGYRKILIQVRASNEGAQSFYKKLGFEECGRLRDQVLIAGVADDEILFEYFIRTS